MGALYMLFTVTSNFSFIDGIYTDNIWVFYGYFTFYMYFTGYFGTTHLKQYRMIYSMIDWPALRVGGERLDEVSGGGEGVEDAVDDVHDAVGARQVNPPQDGAVYRLALRTFNTQKSLAKKFLWVSKSQLFFPIWNIFVLMYK